MPRQPPSAPGDQLGRLEQSRTRFGVDAFTEARDGLTFNAFVSYDLGTAFDRSLEFNENNKANPSTIATAELGPWTRASSQWTADHDDRTWNLGVGTSWQVVPHKAIQLRFGRFLRPTFGTCRRLRERCGDCVRDRLCDRL